MTQNAEAGHIGNGMDRVILAKFGAHPVKQGDGCHHFIITGDVEFLLLEGGGIDADADCLGQDQRIAGTRTAVLAQVRQLAGADDRQSVDRFRRVDGMPASNRNARFRANAGTTFQDFADHLGGHLVHRHSEDRQRHDRRSAHGIDVGYRIGGRDASEVERIIHHRHEEIRGGDHAVFVVQLPDGGIVAGFRSDEKLSEGLHDRLVRQQVLQNGRSKLAAAAAAMGKRAQTNRRCNIHDILKTYIVISRAVMA